MRCKDKIASCVVFIIVTLCAIFFKAQMSDTTAQSLVTFFSVVFGFYMTSIGILYNSAYTKRVHKIIDENAQKRGTHFLKSYLLISGYCSIFSITSIIIFKMLFVEDCTGGLCLYISSFLFGIVALNILYMSLIFNTIIDGMIEEARQ